MTRKPDEYVAYLLLNSGHREEIRFTTIQDFQQWYQRELMPKSDSNEFIIVPIKNIQGEYFVVRPASIMAIRVEPVFFGSIERS
jgi:hypothetical protein